MKEFFLILLFGAGVLLGAVLHEHDMARNFHRDGDAHAWFVTIKCEDCIK